MGEIKIAKLGNSIESLPAQTELNVRQALEMVTISWDNCEIRINGTAGGLDSPLVDGDIVTLVPAIKGGKK